MTWNLLLDYDRLEDVPGAARVAFGEGGAREVRYDIPSAAVWRQVIAARLLRAGYSVTATCWEPSTNGWHAKIELDPAPSSPMEIVALQAVCGSDPLRESCNVQRAREVQTMGAYAARVLLAELLRTNGVPEASVSFVEPLRVFLEARAAGPDSFWLERWNVLYKPNPARRREAPKQ